MASGPRRGSCRARVRTPSSGIVLLGWADYATRSCFAAVRCKASSGSSFEAQSPAGADRAGRYATPSVAPASATAGGDAVEWGDYEATQPVVDRPLHEVSRAEAEAAFEHLMEIKEARKQTIRDLLLRNGVHFEETEEGLEAVGRWLTDNVESRPGGRGDMSDIWYVVAQDLGLLIGDMLIDRAPDDSLRWALFTNGKSDLAYQRPVIMGFRQAANALFNVDPILMVTNLGIRAIQGEEADLARFAGAVDYALEYT